MKSLTAFFKDYRDVAVGNMFFFHSLPEGTYELEIEAGSVE